MNATVGEGELRLVRSLGRGGFGEVFLACLSTKAGLEQVVAVKLLRTGTGPKSQALERLRDEARMLSRLRHPALPIVHDLVEIDGRIAMVTEYVEGQDLSDCIADGDGMPLEALVDCIGQLAGALDAVWGAARVVHRDIKPENVRIGVHGNVKLLDFGIARSEVFRREADTESRVLVGSARYLAPERFDPDAAVTPAADVFGLGCVLYEGVVRVPLLDGLEIQKICTLAGDPLAWARFVAPRVAAVADDEVRELMVRMLDVDPEQRPGTAEVAARCERIAARPGAVTLRRWARERRWPAMPEPYDTVVRRTSPTIGISGGVRSPSGGGAAPSASGSGARRSSTTMTGPRVVAIGLAALTVGGVPVAGLGVGAFVVAALIAATVWWNRGPEVPAGPALPRTAATEIVPAPAVPVTLSAPAAPAPAVTPAVAPAPVVAAPVVAEPVVAAVPRPAPRPVPPAEPGPPVSVTFASVPAGLDVLDGGGQRLGTTPFRTELPGGPLTVQLVAGDGQRSESALTVNPGATRFVWRLTDGQWALSR